MALTAQPVMLLIPRGLDTAGANAIIAQATIEEEHRDEMIVTEHPVETGAAISDHAFKRPSELHLRLGWSGSPNPSDPADQQQRGGDPNYLVSMYHRLLTLQAERRPFAVNTGKRQYTNMLITALAVVTDQRSENALFVTMGLRQIIRVNSKTSAVPAPAEAQAAAQKTAPESAKPAKTATPAPTANQPAAVQSVDPNFGFNIKPGTEGGDAPAPGP